MALAGKNGKICLGTSKIVGMKNWSLSLSVSTLDTTALGDDWKSYILGLKEWTASSDGDYQFTAINEQQTIQNGLQEAYLSGTPVILRLYVDETHYYTGTAVITSLSIDDPVADIIGISIGFTGCGALTFEEGEIE